MYLHCVCACVCLGTMEMRDDTKKSERGIDKTRLPPSAAHKLAHMGIFSL